MSKSLLDLVEGSDKKEEKNLGGSSAPAPTSLLDLAGGSEPQPEEQPSGKSLLDTVTDFGGETLDTAMSIVPSAETVSDTVNTVVETAKDAGGSLLDYGQKILKEAGPYLGGGVMPSMTGEEPVPPAPKPGDDYNAFLDSLQKYPYSLQQRTAGAFEALGAEDNIESVKDTVNRNFGILTDDTSGPLEKGLAAASLMSPANTGQLILDGLDEMRSAVFEEINFNRVKSGAEAKVGQDNETMVKDIENISLRDLFKERGLELSKDAREKLDEGVPKDLSMFQEATRSAVTSGLDLALSGGTLKLMNLLSAGSITSSFAANTWLQSYDDKLTETGDPQRAASHATFSAVMEGLGELKPAEALLKLPKAEKFIEGVKKYLLSEIIGEEFSELTQLASDIAYSDAGQKNTISQNFDEWLDKAPRTAAVTAMSTAMMSGSVAGSVGATVKAANSWEDYKFQREYERQSKRARIAAVDSISMERAKLRFSEDLEEMTHKKLMEASTMEDFENELERLGGLVKLGLVDDKFLTLEAYNTIGANSYHSNRETMELLDLTVTDENGVQSGYVVKDSTKPQVFFGEAPKNGKSVELVKKSLIARRDQLVEVLRQNPSDKQIYPTIRLLEGRIQELTKREHVSNFLKKEGVGFLRELQKTFAPNLTITLHDNSVAMNGQVKADRKGSNGHLIVNKDKSVAIMVNPSSFIEHVELDAEGNVVRFKQNDAVETIAHEFGHAMAYHLYNKASTKVKEAIKQAYMEYRSDLYELYKDANKTSKDILRRSRGHASARSSMAQGWDKNVSARRHINTEFKFKAGGGRTFFHYVHSFDEWFAHEMERAYLGTSHINKLARNHFTLNSSLLKSMHNKAKKLYAPSEIFETFLKYAQKDAEESTLKGMEEQLESIEETQQNKTQPGIDGIKNILGAIESKNSTFDLEHVINPKADLDKFNRFMANVYTLTQIANENQHIPELQQYVKAVEMWWAEKSKWNELAIETVEAWQGLGKDMADRVSKFALAVTLKSDDLGRSLSSEELQELNAQKKYRLSEDAFGIWEQIDNDFQKALGYNETNPQGLYKALLYDIKRIHAANPEAALEAITTLNKEMVEMSNRNFFPLSRFGRYKVTVRATDAVRLDGRFYKKGEIITFETFEDVASQEKAQSEYMRMLAGKSVSVSPGVLSDTQFAYAGFPPNLIKALRTQLGLNEEQLSQLDDLILTQTTASRFKRHLLQRAGVPGFSQDAMRGYASYMANFANAVARMQYAPQLQSLITGLDNTVRTVSIQEGKTAKERVKETNRRAEMVSYLTEHFEYVMNPGNELANLRSVAFLWYLGFMPASAAVNLTQLPMVTWPYLSARKELGGGTTSTGAVAGYELMKAMKDIMNIFKGKKVKFTAGENAMFTELVNRGILDESQAQELAGFAEGSNLQRMLPDKWGFGKFKTRKAAGVIRNVSYAGAFLFHHAEKFNRHMTALAAYRMALKNGLTTSEALEEAHRAVRETQFEYARWNRPNIMRGKKSVIFMFKMYLENILYFMARGDGGRRAILLFFLANGLQGGPGAEDALDIYDFLVNKWNKFFGKKGARSSSREDLRELAESFNLDPNMIMHGIGSRYGLGPVHLLEYAGIPIPNINISGRTSLGRVIPGLGPMLQSDQDTYGRSVNEAAGAVLAVPIGLMQALSSDNPDTWKNAEKGMPAIARYVSQSARYLVRGEETRYNGSTLMPFNLSDPLDVSKLTLHAAGFQSTELSIAKEREWATYQQQKFFETRKAQIMRQFSTAVLAGDREGIADATKARVNYNNSVPSPVLKITGTSQGQAIQKLARERKMSEMGLGTNRKQIPLTRSLLDLYPVEEEATK